MPIFYRLFSYLYNVVVYKKMQATVDYLIFPNFLFWKSLTFDLDLYNTVL